MRITAVEGDITRQDVDAIVNAANNAMRGGGGVDGAIHRAGGRAVLEDCIARFPDGLATGDAGWTTAGELPARWVIHVVGPNRHAGQTDRSLLTSCYVRALEVADELGAGTSRSRWSARVSTAGPRTTRSPPPLEVFAAADTEVEEARLVAFDHATYEQIQAQLGAAPG